MKLKSFSKILVVVCIPILVFHCGTEIRDKDARKDLENGISQFANLEEFKVINRETAYQKSFDGTAEFLFILFSAKAKLKEDVRNYVHHAQEGRYHREYVGWVFQNSKSSETTTRLFHFSLLANLSSERWYDRKTGEAVNLRGVLRYEKDKTGKWKFLGAFDE
ncbi:hypothetical protein [Leptospira ilyithenensis]|uniref:Uncharacterized protein n=1 Tax=Leptospira ilyithenensis TaxID=2484901 RepID=A0A4R9LQN0_9LEPT|nr:hypothetical protein [Leptospira ilyithenensis]TGN08511.1 hypothetical protein EHS11_16615 [Leptospira ilyithenensis]